MPPEIRRRELPFIAAWLAMGALVIKNYNGDKDTVAISVDADKEHIEISLPDYELAVEISKKITLGLYPSRIVSASDVMILCRRAAIEIDKMGDSRKGIKSVAMLKDRSGSGYWRVVFPVNHMDQTGMSIDITSAGMKYEYLREYDTISVQRLCDWESYYILERLKNEGKRIVYDIDDDLFNIPKTHPDFRLIGHDEKIAAACIMKLADAVVVSTVPLAEIIKDVAGCDSIVIPNAVDMSNGWTPTPFTGSPDNIKRIFWQGGNTHADDWTECADAIDAILGERQDVRVVILGFLPPIVIGMLQKPNWKGRVEFLEFSSAETYFTMMKHIKADVGIAPLIDTRFARSKSNLKFLEYTATGMPTVASDVRPYSDTITTGVDGFIAKSSRDWFDSIMKCLDDKRARLAILEAARIKVRKEYDIKNIAAAWRGILVP
jgi:glycosyltransferase involved in cell wall biosynthesis